MKETQIKYQIFTKDDQISSETQIKLKNLLNKQPLYRQDENPQIVFFIGGDGTFLRAVNHFLKTIEQITFIGIHTGTLGFFCDYHQSELEQLVTDLANITNFIHSYRLIELKIHYPNVQKTFLAVNEVRIENPFHTLVSEVYIDDVHLQTMRANGVVVSSTLGSSGYNRSLKGALVSTHLETLQLTEVASLQNNAFRSLGSSLILDPNQKITLKGNFKEAIIGYDHLNHFDEKVIIDQLEIKLSDQKVHIVHQNRRHYLQILRKLFIKDK